MTSLLEVHGLALEHRLSPTDIELRAGQLVALIGPNGGGKTTLLRSLAGIEPALGEVRIDGEPVSKLSPSRRPYVFTFLPATRELVWPITAEDVIGLGLPRPDPERVSALMDLLELGPLAHRPVDRLSTGERARVLLARALASRPRLLLLDEPLSNLDPYWVLRLIDILREIVSLGTSAIVSLHDIERLPAFERALLVSDGKLRADMIPEEMLESPELGSAFRIHRNEQGWAVSSTADRQSSR
jgi:iron complex transport system ATP-binding protein